MNIKILAFGKIKDKALLALIADYRKRSQWPIETIELDVKKQLPDAELIKAEADLVLGQIPVQTYLIVLDERGQDLTSPQFTAHLDKQMIHGASNLTIIIGGACGLDAAVRDRADLILAFGRATWPHQLIRVMLMEQLYRAQTLLAGHPYHK